MKAPTDLPIPSLKDLDRSQKLLAKIQQQILMHRHGLAFDQFMQLALYDSEFGYYNSESFAIGTAGDFITAPHISPLFAACLAQQCQEILMSLPNAEIAELGAGMGLLAAQLMQFLHQAHCLPNKYLIIEPNLGLVKQQQQFICTNHPELWPYFRWETQLPPNFVGIVFANEVLDALPCKRFVLHEEHIYALNVINKNDQLCFHRHLVDIENEISLKRLIDYKSLPSTYFFEFNAHQNSFIVELAQNLKQGIIIFADYGYGRREYYHPERNQGTLTCFYQHLKHTNPLIYPGLQDITAHVDFTSVIETAYEHGLSLAGFTNQSSFLLANHLIQMAEATSYPSVDQEFAANMAIKKLTLPSEMGEVVKFMALEKDYNIPLQGFSFYDRCRDLEY